MVNHRKVIFLIEQFFVCKFDKEFFLKKKKINFDIKIKIKFMIIFKPMANNTISSIDRINSSMIKGKLLWSYYGHIVPSTVSIY